MDLQEFVDMMGDAQQQTRSKYHLTLGQLIALLDEADDDLPVEFSEGGFPTDPHSYRGYYCDLALESTDEEVVVADLQETLEDVHGSELTGYKGGQFEMGTNTPLWQSEWGNSNGPPIEDAEVEDDRVVLVLGEPEF